ncbi:helix-turn-helix transcriptional regulator [Aquibium sp. ELW1220]|uniref:helix-turn-helix domain-containing protein n=1 Tax=Aquibium sp. ELW1220 TaxID=2976766 RepID=UPI0025B174AA|nr:helix-turn-helix transcriptional regulator [Aquibium sp. ELW1220]MDN2578730.1 helix-turn-helix domain-containing protein [Aquibium sp. ELW1220]
MSAVDKFGVILRELRKQRGLTQEELASKTGRSVDAVSQWERGLAWPSFETLILLGRALEVPVKTFFEIAEERSPDRVRMEAALSALVAKLQDDDLKVAVEQISVLTNRKRR